MEVLLSALTSAVIKTAPITARIMPTVLTSHKSVFGPVTFSESTGLLFVMTLQCYDAARLLDSLRICHIICKLDVRVPPSL
jgi:hypothetical protein